MKKFIALLILVVLTPALSHALPSLDSLKTKLNQNVVPSDGNRFRLGDQLSNKKVQVMKTELDVAALSGGTILSGGAHALKDVDGSNAKIPDNAIVKSAWIDVLNEPSSFAASPKICFQVEDTCDIRAAVTTLWYTAGSTSVKEVLPVDGTTVFKTTAERVVYASVTGGALTGGTMNLFIEYLLSD